MGAKVRKSALALVNIHCPKELIVISSGVKLGSKMFLLWSKRDIDLKEAKREIGLKEAKERYA